MAITRKALLISNPGETGADNYCKGVFVDVRNYRALLASATGGAWEDSEIEPPMNRPTKAALRLKIAEMARFDYTFIMFTGHGWYSSIDNDRILELQKNEEIASTELFQWAKKRTLILDCCLKVHSESVMEKWGRMTILANEATRIHRTQDRKACRELFLKEVEAAPSGVTRLSSCSIGEYSYDDDSTGGRYNSSLIGTADSWAEKEANKSWGQPASLSIAAAHEKAADLTRKRSDGKQNPSIEKAKSGPYFPFAVFA